MEIHIQAIVTVLSLINPAVCAAIFAQSESGRTLRERRIDATKASVAVLIILAVSALIGTRILDVFALSIDAFMVAGGIVLSWMGFSMLAGGEAMPKPPDEHATGFTALIPLVFFAASPGTITGVITVAAAQDDHGIPETALVAVAAGTLVLWGVLLATVQFKRKGKTRGFLAQTISRFMGLIVLSMGVQFGLHGFRSFMGASG